MCMDTLLLRVEHASEPDVRLAPPTLGVHDFNKFFINQINISTNPNAAHIALMFPWCLLPRPVRLQRVPHIESNS